MINATESIGQGKKSKFIISFDNQKEMLNAFSELNKRHPEFAAKIYDDFLKNPKTRNEILEEIKNNAASEAVWKVWYGTKKAFIDRKTNTQEVNIKEEINKHVKTEFEKANKELPINGIFSLLVYGEALGELSAEIEHSIMPQWVYVYKRISNF